MTGHFRLRPRYPLEVRVTVQRDTGRTAREIDARTENLGFGGAFIRLDPPLPFETFVIVAIVSATTWEPLKIQGQVRWVRDSKPGRPAGMGVQFLTLNSEQSLSLHRLFGVFGFEEE